MFNSFLVFVLTAGTFYLLLVAIDSFRNPFTSVRTAAIEEVVGNMARIARQFGLEAGEAGRAARAFTSALNQCYYDERTQKLHVKRDGIVKSLFAVNSTLLGDLEVGHRFYGKRVTGASVTDACQYRVTFDDAPTIQDTFDAVYVKRSKSIEPGVARVGQYVDGQCVAKVAHMSLRSTIITFTSGREVLYYSHMALRHEWWERIA